MMMIMEVMIWYGLGVQGKHLYKAAKDEWEMFTMSERAMGCVYLCFPHRVQIVYGGAVRCVRWPRLPESQPTRCRRSATRANCSAWTKSKLSSCNGCAAPSPRCAVSVVPAPRGLTGPCAQEKLVALLERTGRAADADKRE